MKTIEKIAKALGVTAKIMTWLAWAAFVYGLGTLETPTTASCMCLVFSSLWLITSALLKEELAGDDA